MNALGRYRISVLSVNVSRSKGTSKQPVQSIEIDGEGIVGDAHRGTGKRSVSLLDRTLVERLVRESDIENIPAGSMGENITCRIIGDSPRVGDFIKFDGVVLRVEKLGKECHGEGCEIYRRAGRCVMPSGGIFCSVSHGGRIEAGIVGESLNSSS